MPPEINEALYKHRQISNHSDRASAYKALTEKFSGYFRAVEDVQYDNDSNMNFLIDILIFFENESFFTYSGRIKEFLLEYQQAGYPSDKIKARKETFPKA